MPPVSVRHALVTVSRLAVVAHDLHPADHLTDGKETKNLSGEDADLGELLSVDVADGLEDGLRIVGAEAGEDCRWVADRAGHRLEVGLELSDGAGML